MIGRVALRMATIGALMGKTLVGDNVLDSEFGALDVAADNSVRTDQEKPFISVYVDGGKDVSGEPLRALHRSGLTTLAIEIGVTAAMTMRDENDDKELIGLGLPVTDANMEFKLDVVGRQIVNALTDPADPWAEIWRGLSENIESVEWRRTADATGTRVAAHQLVIMVRLRPDPVFGEPVATTSIWSRFFDQLAVPTAVNPDFDPSDPAGPPALIVEPIVAAKAVMLQSLIGQPGGALSHEAAQRRFGLTLDEATAMLLVSGPDEGVSFPTVEVVAGP